MVTNQDYCSLTLIVWGMEFSPKMFIKILVRIKKCSFSTIIYLSLNIIMVGKMKNKTGDAAVKELIGLKPNIYSFLVDDGSEQKWAKEVNKNVLKE